MKTECFENERGASNRKELFNHALLEFFPNSGVVSIVPQNQRQAYDEKNISYHLYDEEWLAHLFVEKFEWANQIFSINEITELFKTSEQFITLKRMYISRLVKVQIYKQLEYLKEDCATNYDDWTLTIGRDRTSILHNGVVAQLEGVGINKNDVQECLEELVALWRMQTMEMTFENAYNPDFCDIKKDCPASSQLKENWLAIKEMEYYLSHKEFVEQCGSWAPNMKMTHTEFMQRIFIMEEQHLARMKEIRECVFNQDFDRGLD